MHHFGVELHAVNLALFAFERRHGTGARRGIRDDGKARGDFGDVIGVAHPADALFGNPRKEFTLAAAHDLALAVFAGIGMGHLAAERIGDELTAVTNAENGNPEIEYFFIHAGRTRFVYAVGPARENDADGRIFFDLFNAHRAGFEVAVHFQIAHAARNELIVLPAEIQNQYSLVIHILLFFSYASKFSALIVMP